MPRWVVWLVCRGERWWYCERAWWEGKDTRARQGPFEIGDSKGGVCQQDARSSFNGDISTWDVRRMRHGMYMFRDSDFEGDVSAWGWSQDLSVSGMFAGTKDGFRERLFGSGSLELWLDTSVAAAFQCSTAMVEDWRRQGLLARLEARLPATGRAAAMRSAVL